MLKEGAKTLVANAQKLMRRLGEGTMNVVLPTILLICWRLRGLLMFDGGKDECLDGLVCFVVGGVVL